MARDILIGLVPVPIGYAEIGSRTARVGEVAFGEAGSSSAYSLTAATGAFALTGGPASVSQIGARQLILAGQPVPIIITESANRQTQFGSFTYTERTPVVAYSLTAERGALALSGLPATVIFSGAFVPLPGALLLSGKAATLRRSRTMAAETGVFVLRVASTTEGMIALPGSFARSSVGATLTYNSTTIKLIANSTSFGITGGPARLRLDRPMSAAAGAFVTAGQAASFAIGSRAMTAERGIFTLAGKPTGNTLRAGAGSFVSSMADAGLTLNADTFWHRVDDTPETWTRVSL